MLCHSVTFNSLRPHRLSPARLLCPCRVPGKNTGVGCHVLLQRIFPAKGSNLHFLHWRADSPLLSHWGSHHALYFTYKWYHMVFVFLWLHLPTSNNLSLIISIIIDNIIAEWSMLLQIVLFYSFLQLSNGPPYNTYYIFIHSSIDRHLGWFHVLVIVNNAAMKTEVHLSF